MENHKLCATCKSALILNEWVYCKACKNEQQKRWRATPEGKAKQQAANLKARTTPSAKVRKKEYSATPEGRARRKTWRRTPEGKASASALKAKHAATEHGYPGPHHTAKEWLAKCAEYDQCCAYCHEKPTSLTLDHVIPLSKGGSNSIENCVPACLICNSSKGNKDLKHWHAP